MRKTLLSLAIAALMAAPATAAVKVGEKAPGFDGLPAVIDGQESTLAMGDIKEDVIIVAFLANHCPAVQQNEDRIVDTVNGLKGKSVKFIGISCTGAAGLKEQDDIPAIKSRGKEKGYNFTYAFDEAGTVGKAYGATRTPEFFVLDKDRVVRYHGALDDSVMNESKVTKNYVKAAAEALLAGKEVETAETRAQGCGIAYKR